MNRTARERVSCGDNIDRHDCPSECMPFSFYGSRVQCTPFNGHGQFYFWATVCKTVRPIWDRCLSCVSVCFCNVGIILWPNGWMDQDATWYWGRLRPRAHCVRWEPSSPYRKGHSSSPLLGPFLLWRNGRPSQQLLSYCLVIFYSVF